jgi:hypothetical protein
MALPRPPAPPRAILLDIVAPRIVFRGAAMKLGSAYWFSFDCPMISWAVKLMPQVGKELPTKKLSD